MALNRLKSGYISNTTHDGGSAGNEAVIGYNTANNRVEFIDAAIDTSALDTISANVDNYSVQLTANVNTVAANADTLVVGVDAAEASLDGVSDNIDSFATYANSTFVSDGIAANTFVTIETNTLTEEGFSSNVTANVSADVLTFTAGNGVAFLANAAAQSITIAAKLSEIAHDRFTADGTANTFTLSREAAAADELIVYVDGVLQVPANNYIVSSTTLTLANVLPLINGTLVDVRHLPVSGSEGELLIPPAPFTYQGSIAGYTSGGSYSAANRFNSIKRISFTSDSNATSGAVIGSGAQQYIYGATGHSSTESGYVAGGNMPQGDSNKIYKFSFASMVDATEVGTIPQAFEYSSGGISSETNGYSLGKTSDIDKFPFSSDTDGVVSTAEISAGSKYFTTASTEGYGYYAGGNSPGFHNKIGKFSTSAETDGVIVGDLVGNRQAGAGVNSATHGYMLGTGTSPNPTNGDQVEKYPFASDSNSSDIAELNRAATYTLGGSSSTTHGYVVGGRDYMSNPNYTMHDDIQKITFVSDANGTDVGELSESNGIQFSSSQQV